MFALRRPSRCHSGPMAEALGDHRLTHAARLVASTPSATVSVLGVSNQVAALTCPVYLTGATLFLSLILSRVFYIILDFIHTQEELNAITGKGGKAASAGAEIEHLQARNKELEDKIKALQSKDRDFGKCGKRSAEQWLTATPDNLKKQASQQAQEYNRLADDLNKAVSEATCIPCPR